MNIKRKKAQKNNLDLNKKREKTSFIVKLKTDVC